MTGEQSHQAPLGLPEDDPRAAPVIALARAALEQIAPAGQLGAFSDIVAEDGEVFAVRFRAAVPGYPEWLWSASLVQLPGLEPSVLEVGLLPGPGALLAPAWVPWAERLAEYEAGRSAEEPPADAEGDDAVEGEEGGGRSSRRRRQRRARTRLRRGRDGEESAVSESEDSEPEDSEPEGSERGAEPEAAAEKGEKRKKSAEKAEKQKAEKPGKAGKSTDASKKPKRKRGEPEAGAGKPTKAERTREGSEEPAERPKTGEKQGTEKSAEPAPEEAGAPREPGRKRDGGRRGRRRVVVVPRLEREHRPPAADGDDFVEVEDVREFADDMDDVLDGVQFEPDDAPEE